MKAKDLMVPVHDFLSQEDTLKDAVNLLQIARRGEEKIGTKGLPVLDVNGRLAGMLSMRDVLRIMLPSYMTTLNLGGFSWDGMVEDIARKMGDKRIGDIMTKVVFKVDEEAPLMECIDQMVKHNIKRLPVVNGSGQVKGMLYERDVFFAVTKAMLEEGGVEE